MADLRIKAEIIGLQEELEKETKRIEKQVPTALMIAGAEMENALNRNLWAIWYEGYKPARYPRRTDNSSLGTPIVSEDYVDYFISGKNRLEFHFNPEWEHKTWEQWSFTPDEGIEWIQREHGDIPARPFWNVFLREQSQGQFIDNFIKAMGRTDIIADEKDRNIDFDEFMLPKDPSKYN